MVKIAIPSNGPGGLEDIVASRFARAAKFTIVEVDEKGNVVSVSIHENPVQAASGAGVKVAQWLLNLGV
ncbi:MAG: dinitrogenase iron-molybdenum cofactor, partial [Thermoprotei archaeon]